MEKKLGEKSTAEEQGLTSTATLRFHYYSIISISTFAIILYFNSLNNAFLFDDIPNITQNPYIRNLEDIPLRHWL
jgi:hypothetical protein